MTLAIVALLASALACFAVAGWQDYQRWKNPNGFRTEFGDVDTNQLQRIERNQRQVASMDRGAQRS